MTNLSRATLVEGAQRLRDLADAYERGEIPLLFVHPGRPRPAIGAHPTFVFPTDQPALLVQTSEEKNPAQPLDFTQARWALGAAAELLVRVEEQLEVPAPDLSSPPPKAFHEYLVRLGLEAFDRARDESVLGSVSSDLFETHLRERMAQAATVYATALEPELPPAPPHKPGPSEPLPWQHELAWAALPPLVRASAASNVVDWLENQRSSLQRGEKIDIAHGMTRRLAVNLSFSEAYGILASLCAALTREADAEAVARGIDADIAAPGATWAVKK